jgi:hypothetical protein
VVATIDTTQAQYFIPEVWANAGISVLRRNLVATPRLWRDSDVASFARGDILHIPYPGTFTASDKAAGTVYTLAQPEGETEVQLALNKHKAVSFVIEDIVRAQASQDVMNRYVDAAAISLVEQIETDVITELQTATATAGTYGTDLALSTLRTAGKTMTDSKCPRDNRTMVISTTDRVAIAGDSGLVSYFAQADPAAISEGRLGRLEGFDVFESQFIGESGASVTLATSAAVDDIVDTATAHGFVAGDVVEFPTLTGGTGLTASTQYFVIAANLAAQTFQVSTTAGGAAVNFTADITAGTVRSLNRKNVAFRRDGAIVGFRGLPEPPAGSGAVAANIADPVSGVVLRALMAYRADLGGVSVTLEVLYGVKALDQAKLLLVKG